MPIFLDLVFWPIEGRSNFETTAPFSTGRYPHILSFGEWCASAAPSPGPLPLVFPEARSQYEVLLVLPRFEPTPPSIPRPYRGTGFRKMIGWFLCVPSLARPAAVIVFGTVGSNFRILRQRHRSRSSCGRRGLGTVCMGDCRISMKTTVPFREPSSERFSGTQKVFILLIGAVVTGKAIRTQVHETALLGFLARNS